VVENTPPLPVPPLLLDAMLGRLARWLRLMGYDAAYLADTDDIEVVRLARAEARLILTRDRGLAARRGVQAMLIDSQAIDEQIRQVLERLGPPPEPNAPRCAVCNRQLEVISKEAAESRVPPYVWRSHTSFRSCPGCHRVYWNGTHWTAIRDRVNRDSRLG
jgi:uncharacterized protein with PIN domain